MSGKLPPDAFSFYASLGEGRSYERVASHFGVNRRTVTRRANAENWQQRLEKIQAEAQARTDESITESLEAMNRRHLKLLEYIQRKALQALRSMPIATSAEAVRAMLESVKTERIVRGEPGDRTAVAVEDVVRREYARWMTREGEDEDVSDEQVVPLHDDPAAPESDPPAGAGEEDHNGSNH